MFSKQTCMTHPCIRQMYMYQWEYGNTGIGNSKPISLLNNIMDGTVIYKKHKFYYLIWKYTRHTHTYKHHAHGPHNMEFLLGGSECSEFCKDVPLQLPLTVKESIMSSKLNSLLHISFIVTTY